MWGDVEGGRGGTQSTHWDPLCRTSGFPGEGWGCGLNPGSHWPRQSQSPHFRQQGPGAPLGEQAQEHLQTQQFRRLRRAEDGSGPRTLLRLRFADKIPSLPAATAAHVRPKAAPALSGQVLHFSGLQPQPAAEPPRLPRLVVSTADPADGPLRNCCEKLLLRENELMLTSTGLGTRWRSRHSSLPGCWRWMRSKQ